VDYDVIIVGAGPAGLSAALILGRCRRTVLVLDTDRPRNAASHAVHGFLSRDGIHPREFRRIGRQQLAPYRSVKFARKEATRACQVKGGFEVTVADGKRLRCRKLLLATGVVDELPPLEGLDALYGHSVFHCPYCDGWESRDQPMAVYSRTANGVGLAIELTVWSKDIVLCTDGARIDAKHGDRLEQHKIPWRRDKIARLEGSRGRLRRIVFANGESLARRVMFFSMGQRQASHLAGELGCGFTHKGAVRTGEYEVTDIHGVYVAGDASKLVQLAIVAAAEGAQAAFSINKALIREDLATSGR
jgi:thioredoxin reductase